jgi:hypothetical protein
VWGLTSFGLQHRPAAGGNAKDKAAINALQDENKTLEQTIQQILTENRESVRFNVYLRRFGKPLTSDVLFLSTCRAAKSHERDYERTPAKKRRA